MINIFFTVVSIHIHILNNCSVCPPKVSREFYFQIYRFHSVWAGYVGTANIYLYLYYTHDQDTLLLVSFIRIILFYIYIYIGGVHGV